MKSSGIIFPDRQDEKDIEKTFGQEYSSTQDFRVNSASSSKNSPISGPAESEIENKQFNYDIQRTSSKNYIAQSFDKKRNTFNNNGSVKSYKRRPDDSNISKSFKIDHEKARLREIRYKAELKRIKGKNNKSITKMKSKVVIKKSRKSSSNNKPSLKKTENKKRELKSQIDKAKKNESEKKESILKNIFSLNIVENIILRYIVAIISGVIIFGIIFSGLGLINR